MLRVLYNEGLTSLSGGANAVSRLDIACCALPRRAGWTLCSVRGGAVARPCRISLLGRCRVVAVPPLTETSTPAFPVIFNKPLPFTSTNCCLSSQTLLCSFPQHHHLCSRTFHFIRILPSPSHPSADPHQPPRRKMPSNASNGGRGSRRAPSSESCSSLRRGLHSQILPASGTSNYGSISTANATNGGSAGRSDCTIISLP